MEARALYKRRGKIGLTDREKRKEDNKLNSKAKRDDLLASRRRMINSKQGELDSLSMVITQSWLNTSSSIQLRPLQIVL